MKNMTIFFLSENNLVRVSHNNCSTIRLDERLECDFQIFWSLAQNHANNKLAKKACFQ